MARTARRLHELVPIERNGKAYVWRTKWIYLGKWNEDGPSAEAVVRLAQFKELWTVDPGAKVKVASSLLLIELWRAWESSPECPTQSSRDDFDRVDRLLFGKKSAPGAYAFTILKDFTARELRAWQSHLCVLKDDRGGLRLGRDTIRRSIKLVRQCFAWGVVEGKVDQNHAGSLMLVESPAKGKVKEGKKRQSLDRAFADKTLPFLSPPLRAAIKLLWLTTARPSEVLGLRVADIMRTGTILLRGGAKLDLGHEEVWAAVLEEHKTAGKGFERVLFFGPKSQAILYPYLTGEGFLFKPREGREFQLAAQAEKQTTTGKGSKKPVKGEMGKRRPGEFYTSGALQKAVRLAATKAGSPHWTVYQVRHTASAAIMDSHGSEAAGVFMGHKPRGITGNYVGNHMRLAAKVARECG